MRIAYIMSRFPLLSETFIVREMDEIEKQGGEILLFPLICQDQGISHYEAEQWLERRNCIPFMDIHVLKTLAKTIINTPLKFITVFIKIVFWNLPSPKFLIRTLILFPKAIHTAYKIQDENIDHIHVHYASHPALVAYIIHQFTGISYSITIHSHDIYDNHVMLKQKLEAAKFLITISNFNVDYLVNLLGKWVQDKVFVIHSGVNLSEFIPKKLRQQNNSQKYIILQIGSLHWKKGQSYLLNAIKLLDDEIDDLQVQIIGDGPERKKIEKMINELSLTKTVQLLGPKTQSEVKKFLRNADCYIQTSVSEGIPVALMEALACELPVISTNITGIPELVIHGKTGILIPPKDEVAIVDAITFIKNNPAIAKKYGKAGRSYIESEYNLQKNVGKLIDLFQAKIFEDG
jgi:colanic acid/amylovoran biosynthesis glycosyltransferase